MPELTTEAGQEKARRSIEVQLARWQAEDFVMPGWQLGVNDDDGSLVAMFQLCHEGMPEVMTQDEFAMFQHGWDARRAAVLKRTPRPETIRHP